MSIEELKRPTRIDEDRIQKLKELFPEAFVDGRLDLDVLKEEIQGESNVNNEEVEESYGLQWVGKKEARRLSFLPAKGTLKKVEGAGVNEESTNNILIEGDNLEVLRILQKSYSGRIRAIYIDPPYNTGNDFIYKDDFKDTIEKYLIKSGQADEEGLLTSNPKAGGRYHANWLNMMYPRLKLARNLLEDTGVIFVSIDDNEYTRLKLVLDSIFGEENYVGTIVWKKKYGAGAKTKGFIGVHEYILCYSKRGIDNIEAPMSDEELEKYNKRDEKYSVRGGYVTQPLMTTSMDYRENLVYPIHYNGDEILPVNQWVWSKERLLKAIDNNEVVFNKNGDKYSVRAKHYAKDEKGVPRKSKPISIMNGPFTQEGTKDITELFDSKDVFDFPKPVALIKYLFSMIVNGKDDKGGIFLDFFAGSGTSGQAVLELNQEDGGNRSFILVQIPEPIKTKGFSTIAEITKERLRRSISKLNTLDSNKPGLDGGFRVYKLVKSNINKWVNHMEDNSDLLEEKYDLFLNQPFFNGATDMDVIHELILNQGFPLDSTIQQELELRGNVLWKVSHSNAVYDLYVCLDDEISSLTVEFLRLKRGSDTFICLDNALSNEAKVILGETMKVKTI